MSQAKLSDDDRVRMTHMLWAAQQAMGFAAGRSRSNLESEPMFRRAIVNCIQEIGEAAARVSPAGRALAAGLPWGQMVGMRHRIVHEYFHVDPDLIWEVLDRDLRPLVAELRRVLPDAG